MEAVTNDNGALKLEISSEGLIQHLEKVVGIEFDADQKAAITNVFLTAVMSITAAVVNASQFTAIQVVEASERMIGQESGNSIPGV